MKGIYLIAIAFLASRTAASMIVPNEFTFEAEDECPQVDTCPPKLIADKSNCGQFYRCKSGKKVLVVCAGDLQFSERWQGCINRDKSDCRYGGKPDECKSDDDLLPHECQCDKFYECRNSQKILQKCEFGQIFKKDRKMCVPGKELDGKCIPNSEVECINNGEYLPHECRCDKYYECKNNRKALRQCPEGFIFAKECVRGTTCPTEVINTCYQGENKTHDCSRKKYYTCNNNTNWILKLCEEGQHFSPIDLKCMTPKDASCDGKCPIEPREPGDCPEGVPTRWRHECDCRLYYECENNKKKLKVCAWGKYFDYVNQVCEKAEKVSAKCKNNWDDWV